MNPNKFLVTITDINQIDLYKKASVTNFLFPLKDFCVGFLKTFSIEEIESGYLYINRILDTKAYQKLKELMQELPEKIKGLVFEDFGVITLAHELQLKQQLILYQTHFATNYQSINENLSYVDSIVLGTDITNDEIKEILLHVSKPLVYVLYGLVPAMYSRRTLLTNFEKEYHLGEQKKVLLKEQVSHEKFLAVENEYGTMLYHDKYLNAQSSINDAKILFYLINPIFLTNDEIKQLLEDLVNCAIRNDVREDTGFLNQRTIYRLKGEKNE